MKPSRKHRFPLFLAILLLTGFATGCSDDDDPVVPPADNGPYDLTFTGTAAPHANQMLRVVVFREGDGRMVMNDTQTVGADGTFSFTWPDLLLKGFTHRVDFYADHNGNGECDPPGEDHSWRRGLGVAEGDQSLDFQHDTNFTDVCDSFEFGLAFTASLPPHAGQFVRMAVVKLGSDETIFTDSTVADPEGGVQFDVVGILEDGHDYHLDFYADHNENGVCDPPPTDHAWRIALDEVRGDVVQDFQHDTNFTAVCSSFPAP